MTFWTVSSFPRYTQYKSIEDANAPPAILIVTPPLDKVYAVPGFCTTPSLTNNNASSLGAGKFNVKLVSAPLVAKVCFSKLPKDIYLPRYAIFESSYVCDSFHDNLPDTINGDELVISEVSFACIANVIKSGPAGNTESPPRILLPISIKAVKSMFNEPDDTACENTTVPCCIVSPVSWDISCDRAGFWTLL